MLARRASSLARTESLILTGAAARRPRSRRPWGAIVVFIVLAVVLYAAFCIYPVDVTFYDIFHTLCMDLVMLSEYVGFEHFREMLAVDDVLWKAARNSL